jgi:nucleoside-diphosphate-sugar epimerase
VKHLVTGGSGFLGNLIARRLAQSGEDVTILDIWEDPQRPKEIRYVHCDIRDREGVARAMQGIDVVHHNVALVPLTKSGKTFWDVNVRGSEIAAEEAVKAGVKNFIHMSSSAIYGAPPCPITSATPLKPIEIYGRGKLAGEQHVERICREGGLPLIVIRPRTILGEGRLGIFQILFDWIREGRNVYVIGDGSNDFQFIHAHDLMDAYMLVLRLGRPGIYNVGTDRFGTLREAIEGVVRHAGTKSKVKSLPVGLSIAALRTLDWLGLSPLAPWHYLTYHKPFHFDMSPLTSLGWKAKYSNDEMLRESYDWYLANRGKQADSDSFSPHRKPVQERILKWIKAMS